MMALALTYTIFIVLFMFVGFFGLGPVLLADGPMTERMITLLVVLLIFFVLGMAFKFTVRKIKSRR